MKTLALALIALALAGTPVFADYLEHYDDGDLKGQPLIRLTNCMSTYDPVRQFYGTTCFLDNGTRVTFVENASTVLIHAKNDYSK
jgi:hypothetical protein